MQMLILKHLFWGVVRHNGAFYSLWIQPPPPPPETTNMENRVQGSAQLPLSVFALPDSLPAPQKSWRPEKDTCWEDLGGEKKRGKGEKEFHKEKWGRLQHLWSLDSRSGPEAPGVKFLLVEQNLALSVFGELKSNGFLSRANISGHVFRRLRRQASTLQATASFCVVETETERTIRR